jgi:hypothetical protein
MCNGTAFQKWQADAIRLLIERGHTPSLLIVDGRISSPSETGTPFGTVRKYPLLWRAASKLLFKIKEKGEVDLGENLKQVPRIVCHVMEDGFSEYFRDENLKEIEAAGLDFILRFGFNIVRGAILNAAKYGIWSFHHDDEMLYRGGPPGFWPIYYGNPVSAAVMQRLTERLDAGIILKKAWLKTLLHSYRTNLDVLLLTSANWPADMADQICRIGFNPGPASHTQAPVYKVPGNWKMFVFLLKLLLGRIKFYWNDLLRAERWNVGVIHASVQDILSSGCKADRLDISWMKERSSRNYIADPAGFIEENKLHFLMEDYSYAKNKAYISESVFDPLTRSFSVPLKSIETKEHLSYPFIFVHGEDIYCTPESYRYGNIVLFKRNYSEGTFVEDHIILDNINAVDPTLIPHAGKWWLFFTIRKFSNSHLYLYFSDELEGVYTPHPANPVKMDVRSSRPAGMPFIHNGILYRPGQDCSESYGRRVAFNKIVRLSETEFEEETECYFGPLNDQKYAKGIHTIFSVGRFTLIDGKRSKFNLAHFSRQTRHKFRKH